VSALADFNPTAWYAWLVYATPFAAGYMFWRAFLAQASSDVRSVFRRVRPPPAVPPTAPPDPAERALVREGSECLTPVIEFIKTIGPMAAAVGTREQVAERLKKNDGRWEELRPLLRVYANQHPSPKVPERTEELVEAVRASLQATFAFAYTIYQPHAGSEADAYGDALGRQTEAQAAADALLREIRKLELRPPSPLPSPS
jgi:hypothetical protein